MMLSQKRPPLLGVSPAFKDISQKIRSVANTETTVLVSGETGTGKELVARAIHDLSSRKPGPFIPIDCAGIPENLFDGELFGHRRGAFTGAQKNRVGKLMGANGGTLFLDAIDSLSINSQTSLLRVIQEKEILPLGQTRPRSISFRLVTSVSHDFSKHLEDGKFRKDLYFRINVVHLCLPPLRQRKEDIAILTKYFLENTSKRFGKKVSRIESKALHILEEYNWPGNVRELLGVIECAVASTHGEIIHESDLPLFVRIRAARPIPAPIPLPQAPPMEEGVSNGAVSDCRTDCREGLISKEESRINNDLSPHMSTSGETYSEQVENFQRQLLVQSLVHNGWSYSASGEELGLAHHQVKYLCAKLGIRRSRFCQL